MLALCATGEGMLYEEAGRQFHDLRRERLMTDTQLEKLMSAITALKSSGFHWEAVVPVFFSALLAMCVGIWLEYFKSYRDRARHAKYLAVRVTCIFDQFITGCDHFVSDAGNDGEYISRIPKPTLATFPSDLDWKSIPTLLTYEILTFPNAIKAADDSITFYGEVNAGPPDYSEAVEEQEYRYALLGLQAEKLANKLRGSFAVPKRDDGDGNLVERLCKSRDKIEGARREAQAANAAFFNGAPFAPTRPTE